MKPITRRTALKSVAGAAVAGAAARGSATHRQEADVRAAGRPNILLVLVDQLRFPSGLFSQDMMDQVAPNLAELRAKSVRFTNQYIAAAMCSPSRACLLTGTYTHQNGMFLTNTKGVTGVGELESPSLNPAFPTFGSVIRDMGYKTHWMGKWHISSDDQTDGYTLERFGFETTKPTPSPNGGPGQGMQRDGDIADLFVEFVGKSHDKPWLATVSLINPHDIAFYPKGSAQVPVEQSPPSVFQDLPPNFETPVDSLEQGKPSIQRQFMLSADTLFGPMPYFPEGTPAPAGMPDGFPQEAPAGFPQVWHVFQDLYVQLTAMVDKQIGRVLAALESSAFADNTIVVFTSDHGEYLGSHGLRGKGGAVYDESIRVPLYVHDPTGTYVTDLEKNREQLTSSVDIMPLLLTLAMGSGEWRNDPKLAHLSNRLDLTSITRDASAPGRAYIVSTSDEEVIETGQRLGSMEAARFSAAVPQHVIGLRTADAKLGHYSFFEPGTTTIAQDERIQTELYDYVQDGPDELVNRAPSNPKPELRSAALHDAMLELLMTDAIPNELHAPLPEYLTEAQTQAFEEYLAYIQAFAKAVQPPEGTPAAGTPVAVAGGPRG